MGATGLPPVSSIQFTLPSLPPSSNSLYNVLFALRKVELKPEARLWKSRAKEYVPKWQVNEGDKLSITFLFFGRWYSAEGKLLKKDVTNREKLCLDAIAEKQGWDDSQVFYRAVSKVQAEQEKVEVRIVKIGLDN